MAAVAFSRMMDTFGEGFFAWLTARAAMITDGYVRTIRTDRGKDRVPVHAAVPERRARPAMHRK